MNEVCPDFLELCELLNANRVEYVIVGAHAVAFHGAPRFTGDLDLLINPVLENVRKLITTIAAFGFPASDLDPDYLVGNRKILQLGVPPVQIHVMFQVSGLDWQDAWNSRVAGLYGACPVNYVGRSALIRNKRASGRTKDFADVEALEQQGGSQRDAGKQ